MLEASETFINSRTSKARAIIGLLLVLHNPHCFGVVFLRSVHTFFGFFAYFNNVGVVKRANKRVPLNLDFLKVL